MARRKNPRYRPMPPGWQPKGDSVGAGILSSPWNSQDVIERKPDPRPWIENPLSRPQAEMLLAAASGTLVSRAGKVSIEGRFASVVTLRGLRERGLITETGARITDDGLEAIKAHRL